MNDLDEDGNEIIKPKRSRRIKERPKPVVTAELKDFNKFFLQHYTPSSGEGELEPFEDDDDSDDEVLGDLPNFNDSLLDTSQSFNTTNTSDLSDSTDLFSSTPQSAQNDKSFADIMCKDAATRLKHVLDWRKFIMEKISQKKADFDIHVEETNVIESIGEVGKSAKYKDICAGKSSEEVSHNFIAMLHLVNTHNVSVEGIQEGKLSDDSLEIKLLSTDRHHEHLDEYNAPSTEAFHEKMVCVKNALKRQKSANGKHYLSKKMKA